MGLVLAQYIHITLVIQWNPSRVIRPQLFREGCAEWRSVRGRLKWHPRNGACELQTREFRFDISERQEYRNRVNKVLLYRFAWERPGNRTRGYKPYIPERKLNHMVTSSRRRTLIVAVLLTAVAMLASVVSASHSWGNYHWARTSNPFSLKLGDNTTGPWPAHLSIASSDWTQSTVLNTTIVTGGTGGVRRCPATLGRVEVCNAKYGQNGWLGIASIWANGDHITQGTVKLNDTYFNMAQYNTNAWRQFVMCQEVGHTFGLDHQDTTFDNPNLGSCMATMINW